MSCQRAITAKITEKKADYVIGLKGNRGCFLEEVKLYFANERVRTLIGEPEKNHGRIDKREYFLETGIECLSQKAEWTNLNAIGAVRTTVEKKGEIHQETRYFITSLKDYREIRVCH
jgi:hypothetical protein